jgi:hypothetical protein
MNCLKTEEQFSAYLEDELDYHAVKAFETHLANCESCRHELALFHRSVNLLDQLPPIEPSPDFDATLRTRLTHIKVESIPLWRRVLEGMRIRPAWAFSGVAVAAFVMIAGIYFYPNMSEEKPRHKVVSGLDETPGIIHYVPPPRIRVDEQWQGEKPLLVPQPNRSRFVKFPTFDGTEFFEELEPRSLERNYILQTVSYTDVPTGGGL